MKTTPIALKVPPKTCAFTLYDRSNAHLGGPVTTPLPVYTAPRIGLPQCVRFTPGSLCLYDWYGDQEVCSDCEAHGLTRHGLTRSDCILFIFPSSSSYPATYYSSVANHQEFFLKHPEFQVTFKKNTRKFEDLRNFRNNFPVNLQFSIL